MTTPNSPERPAPPAAAPDVEQLWQQHRRRMFDIGYRMLGSVADAEDVAAEAYARLLAVNREQVADPVGWLVTVTSRLCVDRLRSAENRKRAYVGPWLPEPIVELAESTADDPADRITLDDTVRLAFLVVLEELSPAERTSFVLHDLFAVPFDEVAEIVGRSPAACRQLASRARRRIRAHPERPRAGGVSSGAETVARRFAHACAAGELQPLLEVLDPEVIGDFDSGGAIPGAPLRAIDGAEPVARILARSFRDRDLSLAVAAVNGEPGVIARREGRIIAVIGLGVVDGRIDLIHAIGNPDKLRHLDPVG